MTAGLQKEKPRYAAQIFCRTGRNIFTTGARCRRWHHGRKTGGWECGDRASGHLTNEAAFIAVQLVAAIAATYTFKWLLEEY